MIQQQNRKLAKKNGFISIILKLKLRYLYAEIIEKTKSENTIIYFINTRNYIVIFISLMFTTCNLAENRDERKQNSISEEAFIIGDIDTAKIISQLAIKESASRLDLLNENIDNLSDCIDTIKLTYYFGFCDCQNWIISEIYNRALTKYPDMDKPDSRGQIEFNIYKHGYYIEAANKELEINWRAQVNGTTIRFIGREYIDKRLPKNGGFTSPNPPKAKVFRYYNYQIIRPYQVWGPFKLIEIDKITGDSIKEPTVLTVKK